MPRSVPGVGGCSGASLFGLTPSLKSSGPWEGTGGFRLSLRWGQVAAGTHEALGKQRQIQKGMGLAGVGRLSVFRLRSWACSLARRRMSLGEEEGARCPSGLLLGPAQAWSGPSCGLGVPMAPENSGCALGSSSVGLSRWQ